MFETADAAEAALHQLGRPIVRDGGACRSQAVEVAGQCPFGGIVHHDPAQGLSESV